ncbi:MAG: hypothetical protein ACYDA8_02320 [Deferrisomatales bacterium]
MNRRSSVLWVPVVGALLGLGLAGCGGGGGGDPPTATPTPTPSTKLGGVAAAGAPIVGTVTVKDSSSPAKTKTETIAADGTYTVDVSGLTPPFALRANGAVGGRIYQLYSGATAADVGGTVNITPLTDLIIANMAGQIAERYFDAGNFAGMTPAALDEAQSVLRARLQPILAAVGLADTIDLLRASFSTDRTGLDAALDVLRVTVDPVTSQASIENIITRQKITDDLLSKTDSGAFTAGGDITQGVTELQKIVKGFDDFAALFATSLPAPNNAQLLALFDSAKFVDGGATLDQFLGEITSQTTLVGLRFNVTVKQLDPAAGTAMVEFVPIVAGRAMHADYNFFMMERGAAGTWRILGNQRIAWVGVSSIARYFPDSPNPNRIFSGLHLEVRDDGGRGIDYAVVSGPGLPVGGLTLVNQIQDNSFQIFPSDPNFPGGGSTRPMGDTEISQVLDNSEYTFELWEDNGTPDNLADDQLLATYANPLGKGPFLLADLSVASFPAVTVTPELSTYTGGSITVTWTLPAGFQSDDVRVQLFGQQESAEVGAELGPTETTKTLTIAPPVSFPISFRNVSVEVIDAFSRTLEVARSVSSFQ